MAKGRFRYGWSLDKMRANAENHLLDDSSASRALANMLLDLIERVEAANSTVPAVDSSPAPPLTYDDL
jgi:hypothetical protein